MHAFLKVNNRLQVRSQRQNNQKRDIRGLEISLTTSHGHNTAICKGSFFFFLVLYAFIIYIFFIGGSLSSILYLAEQNDLNFTNWGKGGLLSQIKQNGKVY